MKLSDYLTRQKIGDAEFGLQAGLSRSQVSRIRRGLSRPSWDTIRRIREATGGCVTAEDFEQIEVAA